MELVDFVLYYRVIWVVSRLLIIYFFLEDTRLKTAEMQPSLANQFMNPGQGCVFLEEASFPPYRYVISYSPPPSVMYLYSQ